MSMSSEQTRFLDVDMTSVRKFMFDRSFDYRPPHSRESIGGASDIVANTELQDDVVEAVEETPMIPLSEHESQLATCTEEARQSGFRDGHAQGEQEARNSIELSLDAHLRDIAEQIRIMSENRVAENNGYADDAVRLALAVARKLFPVLHREHGLAEIEDVVRDCMKRARSEPSLSIEVHESVVSPLSKRLHEVASQVGFSGTFDVRSDQGLTDADANEPICRVSWQHGGMEHNSRHLLATIDEAIARSVPDRITPDESRQDSAAHSAPVSTDPLQGMSTEPPLESQSEDLQYSGVTNDG